MLIFSGNAISQNINGDTLNNLQILFQENFDDNSNNWLISDNKDRSSKINRGHYVLNHKREDGGWYFYKQVDLDFSSDFYIETRLKQTKGPNDAAFGLYLKDSRFKNAEKSYFLITSNHYFKLKKFINDENIIIKDYKKLSQSIH